MPADNKTKIKKKRKVKVSRAEGQGLFAMKSPKKKQSENLAESPGKADIQQTQVFNEETIKSAVNSGKKGPKLTKEEKAELKLQQQKEYMRLKRIDIKKIPKSKRKKFKAQKRQLRKATRPIYVKVIIGVVIAGLTVCFIGGCVGMYFLVKWMKAAPPLDIGKFDFISSTMVYDYSDEEYQELQGTENRIPVKIEQVPEMVQLAFVAIEDQRYYSHFGVDLRGTAKAVISVLLSGSTDGPGGSTITQQLIKLTHLTSEVAISRKVMEWKLAIQLENQLTKREILEAYLNKVNMSITWGVQAAANAYFGVDVSELTLAQSAVLAAIINNPSLYNPYVYVEDEDGNYNFKTITDENGKVTYAYDTYNCERATLIIEKMRELGYISEREKEIALNDLNNNNIRLVFPSVAKSYSYFTDAVYMEVLEDMMSTYNYNEDEASDLILNGGLKIYSTVDPIIQTAVEETASDEKIYPDQSSSAAKASAVASAATGTEIEYLPQVAGAIIENKTGYVVGIIGGREKEGSLTLNRALQKFQTGSVTKPITVYAPGIDTGAFTLATAYDNVRLIFGGWRVSNNSSREYFGMTSVRTGLYNSINIVAVLAHKDVGIETSAAYAELFGFEVDEGDYNSAALALGGYTYGQTTLAVANAFSVFPNGGYRVTPTFYRYVTDSDGTVILQSEQETVQVITEQTAWLVTDVLKTVVQGGTTYRSIPGQQMGGKTGTTDGFASVEFAGFTSLYTGAFWYGYDVSSITVNGTLYKVEGVFASGTGYSCPAEFWEQTFRKFYTRKALPSASLPSQPSGIVSISVDKVSGKLPTELTALDPRGTQVGSEYFNEMFTPTGSDDIHQYVNICEETGLLATEYCPCMRKVLLVKDLETLHKGAVMVDPDYVSTQEKGALAPTQTCTQHSPENFFHVNRIFPANGLLSTLQVTHVELDKDDTELLYVKRELSSGLIERTSFETFTIDIANAEIVSAEKAGSGQIKLTALKAGETTIEVTVLYNYELPTQYSRSFTLHVKVKEDAPVIPDPPEETDPPGGETGNPTDPVTTP